MSVNERDDWANALDKVLEKLNDLSADFRDDEHNSATKVIIKKIEDKKNELEHIIKTMKDLF